MSTLVPLVVPLLYASRHLSPYTTSSPREVGTKFWFWPPSQSQSSAWVPLVMVFWYRSRQRPEPAPMISVPSVPGMSARRRPFTARAVPVAAEKATVPAVPLARLSSTETVPPEAAGGNDTVVGYWPLTVIVA